MSVHVGDKRYVFYVDGKRKKAIVPKTLPYDAEVLYLESTGSQYIDSGVNFRDVIEAFYSFSFSSIPTGNNMIIGAYWDNSPQIPRMQFFYNSGWQGVDDTYSKTSDLTRGGAAEAGAVYNVKTTTKKNYSSDSTMWIYARNNDKEDYLCASNLRLFSMSVVFGDVLVRDFIPVRVGTTGYFFDKVSGELFGNAGTGDFVVGPDKGVPYDAEIEYLESDGNQRIDTKIACSTSHEIVATMQANGIKKANNAYVFFGQGIANNNSNIELYSAVKEGELTCCLKGNSDTPIDYTKIFHVRVKDKTFAIFDGRGNIIGVANRTNQASYVASHTMMIFALNRDSLYAQNNNVRCYRFKILYNETPVIDLIPVRVGTEGYMYDKVSRQLFGNVGTGSFILGPDKKKIPYDAEVEYLESTGDAYIDTGITPTLSYSVEMEFKWVSPWSTADAAGTLFGTMNGWNKNAFMLVCTTANTRYLYNCWGNYSPSNSNANYINGLLDSWHSLTFRDKRTYIDGTSISNASAGTQQPIYSVYVFCANYSNTNTYGKGTTKQIRSFKLYDASSNLVMDLIPVRKGTTGYMYDKVSGQMFGNEGKGDFILGPDKSMLPYDAEVEYLQGDGKSYINTGIKVSGSINMKVHLVDFLSTAYEASWAFGGRYKYGQNAIGLYVDEIRKTLRFAYDTIFYEYNDYSTYPSTCDVEFGGGILKIGTTTHSYTYVPFKSSRDVLLFGMRNGDTNWLSKARIGACYISDGITALDLIPVRVGSTGYMYDKISGTLIGNSGTGVFVLGPDKPKLSYDELLPSLTIVNGQTPAIITDYYPNENSKFVFSCKVTERPLSTANKVIYGTFTYISGTLYRRADCQFKNDLKVQEKLGNGTEAQPNVSYALDTQYSFEVGNNYITIDGNTTSQTAQGAFNADYPLVLFSNCNNGVPSIIGAPDGGFVGVLYGSFDIYEGTTLMRSYHPAKKNGRIGLWESVTNRMLFSSYGEFSE